MWLRTLTAGTATAMRALGARRFRFRHRQTNLAVHALGPEGGEPWVLLHGLGSTALSWAPILGVLRRDCRLLIPELAELGGTRHPRGALSIDESVEAIVALIDRQFPGRAVTIAGSSLGGWIAVRLAMARPELVSRLVLVVAGGYRDQDWAGIQRRVTVETLDDVDRLYRALFRRPPWVLRLTRRMFLRAYSSRSVSSVIATIREEHGFGDQDLASIAVPTAVIWGEHDGLFAAPVGERIARALPRARFYLIADCGHAVHWDRPREFADAIADFRAGSARY
jgi:pimeloyl-ACP methyl ester carboxylesterase